MVPDAAFLAVAFWMALANGPAERHVSGHDRVEVTSPADVSFSEGQLQQRLTALLLRHVIAEPVEDSGCLQGVLPADDGHRNHGHTD